MGAVLARVSVVLDRLAAVGALPGDDDSERLRKGALLLMACLITPLSSIWVITYLALGLWVSAAIPFTYQVVSAAGIAHFLRTKRFRFFRRSQLALILVLPFVLQWSLGGFVESGAVMVWAIAAPFGSLTFQGHRDAWPWFLSYAALIVASAVIDPFLPGADLPNGVRLAFFALNIGVLSAVVFLLLQSSQARSPSVSRPETRRSPTGART
jgi:hypothetical protein